MNKSDGLSPLGRRDVLKILAVGGAGLAAWKLGFSREASASVVQESRTLMGTTVNLTVVSDDREAAAGAVEATLSRMAGLEDHLSRYRADSEISRLVTHGRVDDASEALVDVLRLSERISRMGDGAFDGRCTKELIRFACRPYEGNTSEHGHGESRDQDANCTELRTQIGVGPVTNMAPDFLHCRRSFIGGKCFSCQPISVAQSEERRC